MQEDPTVTVTATVTLYLPAVYHHGNNHLSTITMVTIMILQSPAGCHSGGDDDTVLHQHTLAGVEHLASLSVNVTAALGTKQQNYCTCSSVAITLQALYRQHNVVSW